MSRTVAFWSPTRAGASTLLVNTAAVLAARGATVAVVDFNLITPSLALHLDLLPHQRPEELCLSRLLPALEGGWLTDEEVGRSLRPAGSFVLLPGMLDLHALSRLTEEQLRQLLGILTPRFELVLIDLTPQLDSVACLPIMEVADRVCVVVGPEIGSRFHTRRWLAPLWGSGMERRMLGVLNRAHGISRGQVAAEIGLEVAAEVPNLPGMAALQEAGEIAWESRRALTGVERFRTAIEELASTLAQGRGGR